MGSIEFQELGWTLALDHRKRQRILCIIWIAGSGPGVMRDTVGKQVEELFS